MCFSAYFIADCNSVIFSSAIASALLNPSLSIDMTFFLNGIFFYIWFMAIDFYGFIRDVDDFVRDNDYTIALILTLIFFSLFLYFHLKKPIEKRLSLKSYLFGFVTLWCVSLFFLLFLRGFIVVILFFSNP